MRRIAARLALAGLVASGTVVATTSAAPAQAATADPVAETVANLPLSSARSVVLDAARSQLFVSGGTEGRVVIVDLASNGVNTLPHLAGAGEMDLDDAGEFVWVAMEREGSVARISTTAPHDIEVFPIPRLCTGDLVATAGFVHVTADNDDRCHGQHVEMMRLDPDTGQVTRYQETFYSPELQQIPGTTRFHWQSTGITGNPSGIIDGATGAGLARTTDLVTVDITPDGSHAVTSEGTLLSTVDLHVDGSLLLHPSLSGVHAIGPAALIAGHGYSPHFTVGDGAQGTTLGSWYTDATEPLTIHAQEWWGDRLLTLAGGSPVRLLSIDARGSGSTPSLIVNETPDAAHEPGYTVSASGQLASSTGEPLAGQVIEIYSSQGSQLIATATTAPDGTWSTEFVLDSHLIRVVYDPPGPQHPVVAESVYQAGPWTKQLEVSGPTSAGPGDLLEYTGKVLRYGGLPAADVPVEATWTCTGTKQSRLVSTQEDGTFSYSMKTPRCAELSVDFQVVRNSGSSNWATVDTAISWRRSVLTAHGPSRIAPGETGTWTAQLRIDGTPAVGIPVSVRNASSVTADQGALLTDGDGVVTLTTDSVDAHSSGVAFRYAGDATTLGSAATVPTAVRPWISSLTVTPSTTTPVAREPLTFTGRVTLEDGSSPQGRLIRVADQSGPLPAADIQSDGTFAVVLRPGSGTHTWTFTFPGDEQHSYVQEARTLTVAARTMTLATKQTSSDVRPTFRTRAREGYRAMCIRYRLQRKIADGWRTINRSRCRATNAESISRWRTPKPLKPGSRYRVQSRFVGDKFTEPAIGSWIHLKAK